MRFKLASTLHRTLEELDNTVSLEEFDLWRAYFIWESKKMKEKSSASSDKSGKGKISGTLGKRKPK